MAKVNTALPFIQLSDALGNPMGTADNPLITGGMSVANQRVSSQAGDLVDLVATNTKLDALAAKTDTVASKLDTLTTSVAYGPVTKTLTAPSQQLVLPCAGAASVIFELSGTFTGTISSANSADTSTAIVSPARLSKTGIGSTGRSTITGSGAAQTDEYRAVAGGSVFVLTAGADFSGSVTLTAFASQASAISFTHGAVHDSDEEALRAGRAFTFGTGITTVASGNSLVLHLTNPANSGVRLFIQHRYFTASRADTLIPVGPPFYGLSNPTSAPTGTASVASRGDGSIVSPAVAKFAVVNATNLTALGGTTGPGNLCGGGNFDLDLERTLEPGKAFANYMTNTTSGGLGGAFDILMSITFGLFQEPI